MTKSTPIILLVLSSILSSSVAFVPTTLRSTSPSNAALYAKKNKKSRGGKGFGKAEEPKVIPPPPPSLTPNGPVEATSTVGLSSIDNGSSAVPTIENPSSKPLNIDPNLPEDERAKAILRAKYGLKSYEEQQSDYNEYKAEAVAAAKERSRRMKAMADGDVPADIFALIPAPVLKFIDSFLKIGLGITTVGFVLAGFGITIEAWAKATGNTLPENVDNFIVTVVEPNFTPALGVLLGFSISLGIFASAQLGSSSSQYQERP
uniref:Uncharacterized protein n=1 Tax=Ditylum brightwellii TaxID=49249 RepID=A0A7S4SRY9_9STRA